MFFAVFGYDYIMLKEKFRELEHRVLSEIMAYYGERLISVVLFGSVARETQRFDSDIDLLIIALGLPSGRMKRVKEFSIVEDHLESFIQFLEKDGITTCLSPVFKTPEEAAGLSPLFFDMVEDARILFDKGEYFSEVLEKLKERFKTLGSKRVWIGNAWYWELKPDYKPGEVFKI